MANNPVSFSPAIVTGGCGFTGSHMVRGLLEHEQSPEIHVIARNVRDEIPGVTYHECEISSRDEVQESHPLYLILMPCLVQKGTRLAKLEKRKGS